jgi:hypothetical protein
MGEGKGKEANNVKTSSISGQNNTNTTIFKHITEACQVNLTNAVIESEWYGERYVTNIFYYSNWTPIYLKFKNCNFTNYEYWKEKCDCSDVEWSYVGRILQESKGPIQIGLMNGKKMCISFR